MQSNIQSVEERDRAKKRDLIHVHNRLYSLGQWDTYKK